MKITLRSMLAAAAMTWALATPITAHAADDATAVRQVMAAQFDKPEARLNVEPVVVRGDAAVASWTQAERGGRALLFRRGGQWHIALCAGDGLKQAKVLREAGVKPPDSEPMAQALAAAEAKLPAAQRAKWSTFEGTVRMDAHGAHPPAHKH